MDRKKFLQLSGLTSLGLVVPNTQQNIAQTQQTTEGGCVIIPTETQGPFPLDLSANTYYFRQDVREDRAGIQLNLRLKVLGLSNCQPMQNVRVNIWHCDKDGSYSGYNNNMNPGQAGLTYLRGYQITDANGEVDFITIFPGWYSGRICHIHFQVYISSSYAAISQLSFDIPTKNALYQTHADVYTKGVDPQTFNSDNIFSDGYTYQIATLTPNTTTGGYDSYFEVTVQGAGSATGMGHLEKETAKQVILEQNYPNPFDAQTNIPFQLFKSSEVSLDIWNLAGQKVYTFQLGQMPTGKHQITVNLPQLNLPIANYVYQINVSNTDGHFSDCKLMTHRQ